MRRLTAGPLSMLFDEPRAFLRQIRLGRHELVRGIFAAVRDRDWNTIPFEIHDLELDQSEDRFELAFLASSSQSEIPFQWRGEITGTPLGKLEYRFLGQAHGAFLRNRIGLCVLHPIEECAGLPCRVEYLDGTVSEGTFPKWVSPHQPFKNILAMTHRVYPGVEARVSFVGDAFEMEDQRNWTDASFKTYSTPLEIPFPVEVPEGTSIEQAVTVELQLTESIATSPRANMDPADSPTRVAVDWQQSHPLPPIGFGMSTDGQPPTAKAVEQLQNLEPDHLRVDVWLDRDDWPDRFDEARRLAERVDTKLEVALFASDIRGESWQTCMDRMAAGNVRDSIARWLVFHPTAKATPGDLARDACRWLQALFPLIPTVVGTNAYFAELNRDRPTLSDDTLVCFSINPQVHAFDNLSLSETLGAYRWTVDSACEYFGQRVVVSPLTLRPRFNPNATSVSADDVIEPETDLRQTSGFAAAWTAGAIAALAGHPGVASVTFYETFGPRGILGTDGTPFPMFSVFAALQGFESIHPATSSSPLDVVALAVCSTRGRRLILGNLTPEPQPILVAGCEQPIRIEAESVRVLEQQEIM